MWVLVRSAGVGGVSLTLHSPWHRLISQPWSPCIGAHGLTHASIGPSRLHRDTGPTGDRDRGRTEAQSWRRGRESRESTTETRRGWSAWCGNQRHERGETRWEVPRRRNWVRSDLGCVDDSPADLSRPSWALTVSEVHTASPSFSASLPAPASSQANSALPLSPSTCICCTYCIFPASEPIIRSNILATRRPGSPCPPSLKRSVTVPLNSRHAPLLPFALPPQNLDGHPLGFPPLSLNPRWSHNVCGGITSTPTPDCHESCSKPVNNNNLVFCLLELFRFSLIHPRWLNCLWSTVIILTSIGYYCWARPSKTHRIESSKPLPTTLETVSLHHSTWLPLLVSLLHPSMGLVYRTWPAWRTDRMVRGLRGVHYGTMIWTFNVTTTCIKNFKTDTS